MINDVNNSWQPHRVCVCVYVCIQVCLYLCMQGGMYVHMSVRTHVRLYVHMFRAHWQRITFWKSGTVFEIFTVLPILYAVSINNMYEHA
jgi:hypothetical protein